MAFALALIVAGLATVRGLPVDVLPDLDWPRVSVFLEAPGMAPEEVEALVTRPVEVALNGATGVEAVRSNCTIGLGMVFVEFDYGTDIFTARQIVSEKLQTTSAQLPESITPVLGPISSVMRQIMLVEMSLTSGEVTGDRSKGTGGAGASATNNRQAAINNQPPGINNQQ